VGNAGHDARVGADAFDFVDEVLARALLEEVENGLERVELVFDRGLALRKPANGGAERPANRADTSGLFQFVERLQNVPVDLVDVGVV